MSRQEKKMKFRDIAKQIAYARGFKVPPTAADGLVYHDLKKPFADGQLDKLTEAFNALKQSMISKWDIAKRDQ